MAEIENSMALLRDSELRKFIQGSDTPELETEVMHANSCRFTELVMNNRTDVAYSEIETQLTNMFKTFEGVFDFARVPSELRTRRFIHKTGVAISPQHCLHTIKDVYRVSSFVRAVDRALEDNRAKFGEKLHIVYPACGPLAPLLLPLLCSYKATGKFTEDDLEITFIDIQQGAIMSLTEILKVGGLEGYVKEILHIDATDYCYSSKIHMVILEAMQHGFSREGHLSIAHHFAKMLDKEGTFLPQSVKINAVLVNPQNEFVEQWHEVEHASRQNVNPEIFKDRLPLGEIIDVNLDFLRNMQMIEVDQYTKIVPCSHIKLPELEGSEKILTFCTEINVYKDENLNEYESGITHPLPDLSICINFIPKDKKPDDLYVVSGDYLGFFYRMNGLPGFLVTREVDNE